MNVDFPAWMIDQLDAEAERLGVTRQSIIKVWLAERLALVDDPVAMVWKTTGFVFGTPSAVRNSGVEISHEEFLKVAAEFERKAKAGDGSGEA